MATGKRSALPSLQLTARGGYGPGAQRTLGNLDLLSLNQEQVHTHNNECEQAGGQGGGAGGLLQGLNGALVGVPAPPASASKDKRGGSVAGPSSAGHETVSEG